MINPVAESKSPAGEIADVPESGDIRCFHLWDSDDTLNGYLIDWKTSDEATIMADSDSFVSLDSMM